MTNSIKPLQLLDGPSTTSPKELRRQSTPTILSRHASLGPSSFPKRKENNRRSTGSLVQPVTLVEQHADLLHFIAQKESKCQELREQLAVHEAELLQLKKKWERIVSRECPESATSPVLEGIKEGMQGVGRLLLGTPPSKSSTPSDADEPKQVLIVRDTGASPVVSPNPEFIHQQNQEKEYTVPVLDPVNKETLRARRKARAQPPLNIYSEFSPTLASKKANRLSLPPISSMPGLAFSTVAPNQLESVSSWVGKKWEDAVSDLKQALISPPVKAKKSPPPEETEWNW